VALAVARAMHILHTNTCQEPRVRRLVPLGAALVACVQSVACAPRDRATAADLPSSDSAAIRAVDSAYVAGWLANDSSAVLATLDSDVVLLPAGSTPIVGRDAARRFWWPGDGSRTTIVSYAAAVDEVAGNATLAYLRGTSTLAFTYERDTVRSRGTSRTMTLTVVRKREDGRWRIVRRMWGPLGA
jgi:ketosteroid isomerase-like protein